jgi:hypothetical protein
MPFLAIVAGIRVYPIDVSAAPPEVHPRVAAIGPTQVRKRLNERSGDRRRFDVRQEHADAAYAVALLRPRRERPRGGTAECSDEFAASKANAHLARPCEGTL